MDNLREALYKRDYTYIGSRYYDYPDGQDLIGKMIFMAKATFVPGAIFGYVGSVKPPIPKKTTHIVFKIGTYALPFVFGGLTFSIVTYASTRLRQKDDVLNHLLGGVAGTYVLNRTIKANVRYFTYIIVLITAAAAKMSHMNGLELFPVPRRRNFSPAFYRLFEYPLISDDLPKGWTRDPPPK